MTTWRQAVWEAVQRQGARGRVITLDALKAQELPRIMADTGRSGQTPAATMRRVLQELRDDGVLLFDGGGNYRLAATAAAAPTVEEAIRTQIEARIMARVGQNKFRSALDAHWQARCPLTDIGERALLRASHIVPWCDCSDERDRLDPENGLLLSVLWDAAFDRGLASFADDGAVLLRRDLQQPTRRQLESAPHHVIAGLTPGNRTNLAWHRTRWGFV
ncbi:MAG TPA: HNH endonuclease signature motif containing protein [Polymorphobacter sp.]|nr:HNH endonuclease signature motif containing protein [Polymorphobacter sp.]